MPDCVWIVYDCSHGENVCATLSRDKALEIAIECIAEWYCSEDARQFIEEITYDYNQTSDGSFCADDVIHVQKLELE